MKQSISARRLTNKTSTVRPNLLSIELLSKRTAFEYDLDSFELLVELAPRSRTWSRTLVVDSDTDKVIQWKID